VAAKKAGLPLVVRISDFGLFCPEHHCLRDGAPCTLCLKGDLTHSIRNRCVKGSLALSAADAAATYFHRLRGYFDLVDRWVVTNDFMGEMMVASGIDPQKIVCIPTFTDLDHFRPRPDQADEEEPYLACVGRLDEPKGVHVLIEALGLLKAQGEAPVLKIAGAGHGDAYEARLREQVAALGLEGLVRFLGRLDKDEIAQLMAGARYCVAPSLWYENLPNSIIESLASGTPVIAADIGSLPMTVTHEVDGLLFKAGSAEGLADAIKAGLVPGVRERLSVGARRTAEQRHAPEAHISKLLQLFSSLIATRA
jgi:glycosyltransferase involved in cell wall biosynthesis